MNTLLNRIKELKEKSNFNLPDVLKIYSNTNFAVQQKAKVFYYICIAAIVGLILLTFSSAIVQLNGPTGKIAPQIILPEIIVVLTFLYCIRLLKKGHFNISTHLFMVSANITVWYVMLINKGELVTQFDTVVIILALINVIPLFIVQYRWTVFFYVLLNLFLLFIFIFINRNQPGIDNSIIIDYLADTSIALIFSGLAAYQIVKINNRSLERVEQDYKERKKAEINLAITEERYKSLIESSKDGIILIDFNGDILFVNNRMLEMLGIEPKENLIGKSFLTFFIEKDRTIVKSILPQLSHLGHIENLFVHGRKTDGTSFPAEINFMMVKSNDGVTNTIMANVRDISKRIKAEEDLKKSEMFRRRVFDSSNIPIVIMESSSFKFIDLNNAAVSIYGFDSKEIALGKTPLDVSASIQYNGSTSSELAKKYIQKALDKGNVTFEWLHQRPKGELWDAEVHLLSFHSDDQILLQFSLVDITERKKTEKELKESELKYRTLFNNAQIGIYQTTPEGEIININPAIIQMLGYNSVDELKKTNLESDNHYDKVGRIKFKELIEEHGSVINLESRWKKKNGEIITVIENAKAVKDADGKTVYYDGFVENITEKKKAEMALRESEEKYRTLMESLNEVIIVADNNHVVQFVNKKFTEILGYQPEEIIGKVGFKILHDPADFYLIEEASKERQDKKMSHYELPFLTKDGRKIEMLVSGSPIIDTDGKTIASIGAMVDITERKKAEKALIESQQQFETLAKMSPVGIFRTKPDGYTYYVNPKWCELSGLSSNEAQGDGWLNAVHPEDRKFLSKNWNSASTDGEKSFAEYRFLKPDGSITWVLGNAIPEIIDGKLKGYIGTITNISEIKTAQEKIKESEKKFRDMADLLPIAVWETDLQGVCTYTNKVGFDIHTYTHEDFLAKVNILSLLVPQDRARASENLKKRILGAPITGEEYTGLRKDGNTFPVRVFTSTIYENQKPVGFRGVTVDITNVKEAEEELKQSEEKYRTLMENLNDVIMMVDNDDQVLYVNKKFTEKLGYTPDEIVGKIGYQVLVDKEYHDSIKKANQERLKKETSHYELQFIAKNGTRIDFLISGAPVLDAEGKTIGSIGAMVDITDRKKAEKALKESEEKYRTLMESLNEVIMLVDNEDRIQYVNRRFTDKLGYLPDEIIGEIGYKLLFNQDELNTVNNASKSRDKNMVSQYELSFATKDGRKITFLVSAAPIAGSVEQAPGFLLAMVDITEKKIIEKELEKHRNHLEFLVQERTDELATANEELVSTNEELLNQREELEAVLVNLQDTQKQLVHAEKMASLGVLAAGVAHEINNPLNFIKGGVVGLESYLSENLKSHLEELAPLIEGMNTGIDRAAAIVTSLNHYSRKDDKPAIKCDVHSIIDNCLVMLQNQIKHKIDITKKYTTKQHVLICNEGKIHQAILNVLSNAVQSIEGKGKITIKTDIKDEKLRLVISDTGCGISKENLPKILDPFFTTKDPGKGTGLGLSITYNILQEHYGSIEFSSKLNRGTQVTIKLPLNNQ